MSTILFSSVYDTVIYCFSLEHIEKERQQKNRTKYPLTKKKEQLSETLQHRETKCNGQRGNNYDQCSLQLCIAKTDKQQQKKRSINSSDNHV